MATMLALATQAGAECGKLCDKDWWKTATKADVQAELDEGADIMARDELGATPLHWAADCFISCQPERITTLLANGADPKAKVNKAKTPWDQAKEN